MKNNLSSVESNQARLKRPSAEKTRQLILQTALDLFAQNGFFGTSLRDIAKSAEVNLNLIGHHYGNKENLWNAVRLRVGSEFAKFAGFDAIRIPQALKPFLEMFVKKTFAFWQENNAALRILHWQRLEFSKKPIKNLRTPYSLHLQELIATLQTKGLIRQDVGADVILLLIFSTIQGALEESSVVWQNNKAKKQKEYLKLVIDGLNKTLQA